MKDAYKSLSPEQRRYLEAVWHIFDEFEPVDLSDIQDKYMMEEELRNVE